MTTTRPRGRTKRALLEAAVRLTAQQGSHAATIQSIARDAGVSEGAVYRHFRSKEELCWEAFRQIVAAMVAEKEYLAATPTSLRTKIHDWVRLTYDYFDQARDAFVYVLLTPHPEPLSEDDHALVKRQGALFISLMEAALERGEVQGSSPTVLLSHFTGLMLNIPRLIQQGVLKEPAAQYVDEVAAAVCQALQVREER